MLKQVIRYIFTRKKYWLIPVIFAIGLVSVLILVNPTSPVAPFIYTIF